MMADDAYTETEHRQTSLQEQIDSLTKELETCLIASAIIILLSTMFYMVGARFFALLILAGIVCLALVLIPARELLALKRIERQRKGVER